MGSGYSGEPDPKYLEARPKRGAGPRENLGLGQSGEPGLRNPGGGLPAEAASVIASVPLSLSRVQELMGAPDQRGDRLPFPLEALAHRLVLQEPGVDAFEHHG